MCRAEAPHLSVLQKKYKDRGLVVLGINIDNDSVERIQKFKEEKDLVYPMLLAGGTVASKQYFCRAFPTVVWIDKTGKITGRDYGYKRLGDLEKRAQQLLAR